MVVERGVAGRAGAMRAIAPSTPPNVFSRRGRRRPTSRFCAPSEVIDFALVMVYGLNIGLIGRVAGRAGAMRAIARSMPPHDCPREGR